MRRAMLTKDGWPRGLPHHLLRPLLLLVGLPIVGCHRLAREVYYPAPTPIFMEDGLREDVTQPGVQSTATNWSKTIDGIASKLNPARIEVVKAAHTRELAAGSQASQPPRTANP